MASWDCASWRHVAEDRNINIHHHDLKSHIVVPCAVYACTLKVETLCSPVALVPIQEPGT